MMSQKNINFWNFVVQVVLAIVAVCGLIKSNSLQKQINTICGNSGKGEINLTMNGSSSVAGNGTGVGNGNCVIKNEQSLKDSTVEAFSSASAFQCGGSNGPGECNFKDTTVEGFDIGIGMTSGSKVNLNDSHIRENNHAVIGE